MYLRNCICLIISSIVISQAEVYFKTTKIECSPSPKYFINHTCKLKAINRYKTVALMRTLIRQNLRNVSLNLSLHVRNDVNIYKPFMVNVTVNLCEVLKKSKKSGPYGGIFMKILNAYSNANHTCPFTGFLEGDNINLESSMVPFPMPAFAYKFLMKFYEGYPMDYIGTVTYYMDLVEKRNRSQRGG